MLLVIGFAPLLAAWLMMWSEWRPSHVVAQGQLLASPLTLDEWWRGESVGGSIYPDLGYWAVVEVLPATCADSSACQEKLQTLTSMHLAVGKDANRVRRLWLGDAAINDNDPYVAVMPHFSINVPVNFTRFIVDPHGNLILTYSADLPVQSILKDLRKLLRASKSG